MFIESITTYGAVPGTLCTGALQAAIDACHAAGGGEVFSAVLKKYYRGRRDMRTLEKIG